MSEIRVSAERLNALIKELALAADRCREYGAAVQASRVVDSALNLARNLVPDAVGAYAATPETTAPDRGGREALHAELATLTAERRKWEETTRACACTPGRCTPGEPGCMACADLDPDQPCYAAVLRVADN